MLESLSSLGLRELSSDPDFEVARSLLSFIIADDKECSAGRLSWDIK